MTGRILILDIETQPITALVWGLFNQNISLNQIRDPGGILCVGLKYLGDKNAYLFSKWEHGYEGMITAVHSFLEEADAIITYNGNRFDLPKLRGACAELGLTPPPPVNSIDVYTSVKKLGLISNKLAFVGPFFKIGKKIETGGMELWTGVMDNDKNSQRKMEKYCVQDVRLLEQVYQRLLPYLARHPNIGGGTGSCPTCGGHRLHKRGDRLTKLMRIGRLQCQDCGGWSDGERKKI
jgi:hypothetical protein